LGPDLKRRHMDLVPIVSIRGRKKTIAISAWKNSKTRSISSLDASNETKNNQAPNIPHPIAKTTVAVETSCIVHPPKRTSGRSAIGKPTPSRRAKRTPNSRKLVQSLANPSKERYVIEHNKHVCSAVGINLTTSFVTLRVKLSRPLPDGAQGRLRAISDAEQW
jgi:hypothetical protein